MAETQVIPIECFGTVLISINSPTRVKTMTLLNVAYIPDFMTNLVSQPILSFKGLNSTIGKRTCIEKEKRMVLWRNTTVTT